MKSATPVFAEQRRIGTVDTLRYGTNEIGKPTWTGGWHRTDIYRSFEPERGRRESVRERHFAADSKDYSPVFYRDVNGKYDGEKCECCFLNFSHTLALHDKRTK